MNLSVKEAFDLLLENRTIMVSMYDDADLMECNLEYILDNVAFDTRTNRVALTDDQIDEVWEYLEHKKVVEICANLPLMKGSYEIVKELKKMDYKVVCFSGGFRVGTSPAREKLGLDADFSNILHEKDGILTGLVGGDMMFGYSKGDMIRRLQNLLKISKENTLVCGDGANDLSMFAEANTRVAFCAKDVLKKEANIIVDTKDLTKILEHIKA
jgi:phosphoserine phosphatase